MDISQAPQEIIMGEQEPKPFKEIAKKEKVGSTEEKLPRGKESYTPEELCRILTSEELRQMFTPKELRKMFTPVNIRQMFTPEELRQMFTPEELRQMFTPKELRKMFTPENIRQMFTPENICQMFTPKELIKMFKGSELHEMFTLDGLLWILPKDLLSVLKFPLVVRARERVSMSLDMQAEMETLIKETRKISVNSELLKEARIRAVAEVLLQ